jgi:hypothetical protein
LWHCWRLFCSAHVDLVGTLVQYSTFYGFYGQWDICFHFISVVQYRLAVVLVGSSFVSMASSAMRKQAFLAINRRAQRLGRSQNGCYFSFSRKASRYTDLAMLRFSSSGSPPPTINDQRMTAAHSTSTLLPPNNNAAVEEDSFKVTQVSYNGELKKFNMAPTQILRRTSIFARDLVSLNITSRHERYNRPNRPILRPPTAILPRTDSILLSFGNVRAVASREFVWVFDAHGPVAKVFAEELAQVYGNPLAASYGDHVAGGVGGGREAPELIFLEAVLRDTCDTFARRVSLFEPIVDDFVSRVENEVYSDSGVHQLVPLKDSLQSFELQVKQALQCLTDLLEDDEQMLSLLLTEQAQAIATGVAVNFARHQHVELLLGGYARQISNTLYEIQYLLKRLQSKQEFVALALAGYRNRMVRMNVNIGIVGVSVGFATAIAGFFGMNLASGLEASPNAFGYVVAAAGATSALVSALSMNYLSGKAMQQRAQKRLDEIETLTGALSDMSALDYTVKRILKDGARMDREEFKNHLTRARQTKTATEHEVDFLFGVLDTVKDGHVSSDDFSSNNNNNTGTAGVPK